MAGKFITLEGIDGSGKSTQSGRLAEWLTQRTGRETVCTFEPGGWHGGESLRELMLSGAKFSAMSELLLFLADRAEHVNRVILPALRQGCNVICERWNESTIAYQAGGHDLNPGHVKRIISACNFLKPNIKILLDIPPEIAIERIKSHKPDRFESEGLPLMRRVAEAYRRIASDEPGKFIRVDCGEMTEDDVFHAIVFRLEAFM